MDYQIRIITKEQVAQNLLNEWLIRNNIQYSFDQNCFKSDNHWHRKNCCFCPTYAAFIFYNGHHSKNHNCKMDHGSKGRYTTSHMCNDCHDYVLKRVQYNRQLVFIAIKLMRGLIPQDVCNIIVEKFKKSTSHYRQIIGFLDL